MISFILSLLGFYLIESKFTIHPAVISGNGNLAIIIILLFSPVFIASYFYTFKLVRMHLKNSRSIIFPVILLFLSIISCIYLIGLIADYANELIIDLGGTPSNPQSRIYRFGWFNQYTNSLFFNNYSFILTQLLAVIVGVLTIIFKPFLNK
nr:hypothetical protein [Cytobacillus eiseniae]